MPLIKIKFFFRPMLILCVCLLIAFSRTTEGIEPVNTWVELRGEIVPTFTLSLFTQGRTLADPAKRSGDISLNRVDALGLNPNPIGRMARSPEKVESYYQTDILVRVQVSGAQSPASLIVNQFDSGPLRGLIYEADQNLDIAETANLKPIPQAPQKSIAVTNIPNGSHDYERQIILRIPPNLAPGTQSAIIQYALEVGP